MRIGIPAETYAGETRVAATPETVKKLLATGHKVSVQTGAGSGASIPDAEYQAVGATWRARMKFTRSPRSCSRSGRPMPTSFPK